MCLSPQGQGPVLPCAAFQGPVTETLPCQFLEGTRFLSFACAIGP